MKLLEKIVKKNEREHLIVDGDRIVVGFSGGPDSVFLVQMLLKLKKTVNFEMVLVHINHLLRGKNSDDDEKFSIEYGKQRKIAVYSKRVDIKKIAKRDKIGLEVAGREERYKFYNEVLCQIKGNKIALAHNKDDQIETFMFRLIRGTSLDGLNGIESKNIYIRPISEIYKNEILEYLKKYNLQYRIDETNFENTFTRNSIRLDLIPFIEKRYNPSFKEKIFSLIGEFREINAYFEKEIPKYLNSDKVKINEIKGLSPYLRKKVLTTFLNNYKIDISREKILMIERLLFKGGTLSVDLDKSYILQKDYEFITILKRGNSTENEEILEKILKIPGEIDFGEYIITAEFTSDLESGKNCFCSKLLKGNSVKIRTRKSGDRITPAGMKGTKKLKDIFINEKISKLEREKIPLIIEDDEIVWIAGIRGNEKYQGKNENEYIKFTVRRLE